MAALIPAPNKVYAVPLREFSGQDGKLEEANVIGKR